MTKREFAIKWYRDQANYKAMNDEIYTDPNNHFLLDLNFLLKEELIKFLQFVDDSYKAEQYVEAYMKKEAV
jgi:hypothetical protein